MKKIYLFLFLFLGFHSRFIHASDLDIVLKSNPFWGSNNGNVIPGASTPWGMVKLGPDVDLQDTPTSGYRDNARIAGFSHNHANGVGGAPRYGNIMIIPQADSLELKGYRPYEKQNEEGYPGYYAVTLKHKNNDIRSELTATDKTGFHKYTFSKGYDSNESPVPYIVIDASHNNKRFKNGKPQTYCTSGELEILDSVSLQGKAHMYGGWGGDNPYDIYYYIVFDQPFISYGVFTDTTDYKGKNIIHFKQNDDKTGRFGAYLAFDPKNSKISCRVGISYKDQAQARKNLQNDEKNFDEALNTTTEKWASYFSRVKVKGSDLNAQKNFYSALRSAMLMPTEVTGDVEGYKEPHFWDFYCIWDTYRTVSPLYVLLFPETQRKIIRCLLEIYEKEGYLPDSWIGADYATVQGGSNTDVVLADAVVKNLGGFDYEKALEASLKNATAQSDDPYRKGRFADEYNKLGYVTGSTIKNSVSRSLEYAYDDYCIAEMALACKQPVIYDKMGRQSMNIFTLFHPEYKMFWGKDSLGNWEDGFSPYITRPDSWNDLYFYEGGSKIYSTYVPHDMAGLIQRHGGNEIFKEYLDELFEEGTFKMENEFEFLVPYLYNYTGNYPSTAKRINEVMTKKFFPGRNGIPGQDDAGAMSAWYVFSALGFLPVAGQDLYLIGTPQFEESIISLENGKQFVIKANNLTPSNIYIVNASLNGKPLERAWFRHSEIMDGGILEFDMSDNPNDWGSKNLPPSLSNELKPRKYSSREALQKARNIVEEMSTDEKISMISGHNSFFIKGNKRLGLPELYMSDATGGVHIRKELDSNLLKSVSFPSPVCLAATWNPMLAYEMAKSIGEECVVGNIAILLGPGMNIYRISQNGRNFEYFGEDPYLASRITESYVIGMQSTGTMATLKHFVCNNNEHHRRLSNVLVSERALHEIYLPAFKSGIDAGAACVMTSYNLVNDEYTAESKRLVTDLLRNKLGFNGLVMSDWRSVYDPVKAINSGLDLEMPGDYAEWLKELGDTPFTHLKHEASGLLDKGDISEEDLNRMVANIIKTSIEMGAYDNKSERPFLCDFDRHEKIALEVAREGIVLLKNKNNILPFSTEETKKKKILLTGMFLDTIPSGGGSAHVEGFNNVLLKDALTKEFGNNLKVKLNPTDKEISEADYVLLSVGTPDREGIDRPFALADSLEIMVKKIVNLNPSTIVLLSSGGGVRMTDWVDDCAAILYTWFPGQTGNMALAEILSGKINPSGKLPFTIEREFADSPGYDYKPDNEDFQMPWQDEYSFKFPRNDIKYSEDVFVGYRWYEAKNIKPLFAFGHGLSYTNFEYSDLSISKSRDGDNKFIARFNVSNTGEREGHETVQLYIGDKESSVKRPVKELKDFKKINLNPGECTTVRFEIKPEALAFYDENNAEWLCEPGIFTVNIGPASDNIQLTGSFLLD